jgi:hypothetical protein
MQERHTGEYYQFNLVVSLLNVLTPNWRHQLIEIATDGASTMTGCIKARYEHSSIKWMPFTHLPDMVWSTPTWSCNEASLLQAVQWEIPQHTHKCHGTLAPSAELDCWHEVNVSNICHNMLDVNGKAVEVVDWQASMIDETHYWKKPACTASIDWWIVFAVIYSLVQGVNAMCCSARYEYSHVRTKITIVQSC